MRSHHGKHVAKRAIVVRKRLVHHDLDRELFSGGDVGHGEGEQIGALLLEQRPVNACAPGLLVAGPGLGSLADPTADTAVPHAQNDFGYRSGMRQRHHVKRLDGPRAIVEKVLSENDTSQGAIQQRHHLRPQHRQRCAVRAPFEESSMR